MSRPCALITGGQGTLAQAIRTHFESAGWQVAAPGKDELDVTEPASIDAYVRGMPSPCELLVNNAGVTRDRPFLRLSSEDWDEVLAVNLRGAASCARAVIPGMRRLGRGHLIQIGSFSARRPPSGQAAYASAKAGLVALTQTLAAELGPENIRANCILPGFLDTRMTRALPAETRARALAAHVLGRFNTVEDTARFVETLHRLENVSGQVFQLDSRLARQA